MDIFKRRLQSIVRRFSTRSDVERIRNIGIIAHIDAGKTTTSERMLFYAGYTHRIGDVDRGDTVLDYLPEERERGITITAAAITFPWNDHRINLIDTPGHVDFGMEVSRSLRVMDGAIAIIDGRMAVQAQTRNVWKEADRRGLPRLIFVNKLDKSGADFAKTIADIQEKLVGPRPLPVQWPVVVDGKIEGLFNLITREFLVWKGDDGRVYNQRLPPAGQNNELSRAYEAMLEQLADVDEEFMSEYLANDGKIKNPDLIQVALRRQTRNMIIAPVFAGSALKNIGIQPLMDGIIDYLPHPLEMQPISLCSGKLVALAFKVIHDERRGLMVFIRIYEGILRKGTTLRNISSLSANVKERPTKILRVYADDFKEVDEVGAGEVAVLLGVRHTRTGETLIAETDARAGYKPILPGIPSPHPVFSCSVEAESSSEEGLLEEALQILQLEDPSIRVTKDLETGQRYLSGMGELHLEIVNRRLTRDLKVNATFGEVRISYKEKVLLENIDRLEIIDRGSIIAIIDIANTLSTQGNIIKVGNGITDEQKSLITDILTGALQMGPKAGFPVWGLEFSISLSNDNSSLPTDYVGEEKEPLVAQINRLVTRWLSKQSTVILEPIMHVEVTIPAHHQGLIIGDLVAGRRATIRETIGNTAGDDELIVRAEVPLATMLGYATILRSKTGGLGSFSMEPSSYQAMTHADEVRLLGRLGLMHNANKFPIKETVEFG